VKANFVINVMLFAGGCCSRRAFVLEDNFSICGFTGGYYPDQMSGGRTGRGLVKVIPDMYLDNCFFLH